MAWSSRPPKKSGSVGTKHDCSLPKAAIVASPRVGPVSTLADISDVVYYEKPLVLLSRYLATRQRQGPVGMRQFVRR